MVRLVRKSLDNVDQVTRWHVLYFCCGWTFFADIEEWPKKDVKRVWHVVEPHIMPRWIAALPCVRPWAWWQFSSPEPHRKQLSGPAVDWDEPRCGLPRHWSVATKDAAFESEAEFLQRLNLLAEGESDAAETLTAQLEVCAEKRLRQIQQEQHRPATFSETLATVEAEHWRNAVDQICDCFPD